MSVVIYLGIYTGDGIPEDESLFKQCFQDLVSGLGTPCPCGMVRNTWTLESVIHVCQYIQMYAPTITVLAIMQLFSLEGSLILL